MTARAAMTGRSQQIAQRAVAEEIESLVGHLEFHLRRLTLAAPTHRAPCLLRLEIGRRRDVARFLHLLDDLLNQLLELIAHLLFAAFGLVAEHPLEQIVGQHPAVEQRFEDRIVRSLSSEVSRGLPNPLDMSRSDNFDISSSMSSSSSRFGTYFVYLYFIVLGPV